MSAEKEHVILVGNPGSGKSTLANAMAGQVIFKSGVSIGAGLTALSKSHEVHGVVYVDTPGLHDVETRETAALEIQKALQQEGRYKIFFVITLEAGRVRPVDVTVINLVLDAIKESNLQHSLIVNKVSAQVARKLKEDPANMDRAFAGINSGVLPTFLHRCTQGPALCRLFAVLLFGRSCRDLSQGLG